MYASRPPSHGSFPSFRFTRLLTQLLPIFPIVPVFPPSMLTSYHQHIVGYAISSTILNFVISTTNLAHIDTEWPPGASHPIYPSPSATQLQQEFRPSSEFLVSFSLCHWPYAPHSPLSGIVRTYQLKSKHPLDSTFSNTSLTPIREPVVGARGLDRMSFQREVAPKFAGWGREVEDILEVGFFPLFTISWGCALELLILSLLCWVLFLVYMRFVVVIRSILSVTFSFPFFSNSCRDRGTHPFPECRHMHRMARDGSGPVTILYQGQSRAYGRCGECLACCFFVSCG